MSEPGSPALRGHPRSVPVEQTLQNARDWQARAGITQVTNISDLDELGCHVYASFRSPSRSSPVAYGKGLRPPDAEVGALMESIELALAEPERATIPTHWGTPRDVVGATGRDEAILDFAPLLHTTIELDTPMLLCSAEDVEGGSGEVPAELVFFPAPDGVDPVFGASSNGLASGNCLTEASLQGLFEVIERDIWSFETLRDSSFQIEPDSLPAAVSGVCQAVSRRGLRLCIRYVDNDYRLPFFAAFLFDPKNPGVRLFNGGWGCHFSSEAALISAVCEAVQGRLAVLHGVRQFKPMPEGAPRTRFIQSLVARATRDDKRLNFADTVDVPAPETLPERFAHLLRHLRLASDAPVLRLPFTAPDDKLQVVRIIVPTLEHFRFSARRAGARLRSMLESHQTSGV